MNRGTKDLLFVIIAALPSTAFCIQHADTLSENTTPIKLFIECSNCWFDLDYIRTEIPVITYVRDPLQADIHILITSQVTGSGGREYTLHFIRKKPQPDLPLYSLKYTIPPDATEEKIRIELVKMIRAGIAPFIAQLRSFDAIQLVFKKQADSLKTQLPDPWNYWVLSISGQLYLNGEKSFSFFNSWTGLSAKQVTEQWKIIINTNLYFYQEQFEYAIDDSTLDVKNVRRHYYTNATVIKSLDEHWSAGVFGGGSQNLFLNTRFSGSLQGAIEYNLFPYAESARKQLRFGYRVGGSYNNYVDTTVYFTTNETLFLHRFFVDLETQQPWGSSYLHIIGSQYLHDFSKTNLSINATIQLRLFEGFSWYLYGNYSAIHDQLYLPKGTASVTDVLRQQRQLATSYQYYVGFGLTYSFGSIYNNVVNARFGTNAGE